MYNSKRWKVLREKKLSVDPLCESDGCSDVATDVDHVVGIADGGDVWLMSNLASLCKRCHSRKTMAEVKGVGVGVSDG